MRAPATEPSAPVLRCPYIGYLGIKRRKEALFGSGFVSPVGCRPWSRGLPAPREGSFDWLCGVFPVSVNRGGQDVGMPADGKRG
jgi:hypothetical protein